MGLTEFLNNIFNSNQGPQFQIQGEFSRRNLVIPSPVPPPIDNRPQIRFLQTQISQAQRFFRQTFPKPFNPVTRANPNITRGPNLLGSLARKGNRLAINPFTGALFVVGTTFRSSVTNFAAINRNFATLQRGLFLQSQIQSFIAGSRTQIDLLRSKQTI